MRSRASFTFSFLMYHAQLNIYTVQCSRLFIFILFENNSRLVLKTNLCSAVSLALPHDMYCSIIFVEKRPPLFCIWILWTFTLLNIVLWLTNFFLFQENPFHYVIKCCISCHKPPHIQLHTCLHLYCCVRLFSCDTKTSQSSSILVLLSPKHPSTLLIINKGTAFNIRSRFSLTSSIIISTDFSGATCLWSLI